MKLKTRHKEFEFRSNFFSPWYNDDGETLAVFKTWRQSKVTLEEELGGIFQVIE